MKIKSLFKTGDRESYFEGETDQLPPFYKNIIQNDPGVCWKWLHGNALKHDANAYLHKTAVKQAV